MFLKELTTDQCMSRDYGVSEKNTLPYIHNIV